MASLSVLEGHSSKNPHRPREKGAEYEVQYGQQANGTQRYRCDNPDCPRVLFLLQYHDRGRRLAVQQQIIAMTLNGSGVCDIVRVLRVSSATVLDVLKKKSLRSTRSTNVC